MMTFTPLIKNISGQKTQQCTEGTGGQQLGKEPRNNHYNIQDYRATLRQYVHPKQIH